jgi:hypothetical protein
MCCVLAAISDNNTNNRSRLGTQLCLELLELPLHLGPVKPIPVVIQVAIADGCHSPVLRKVPVQTDTLRIEPVAVDTLGNDIARNIGYELEIQHLFISWL